MKLNFPVLFILIALLSLLLGGFVGMLISFSYLNPDFLKDIIPFNQLRPMHTTAVISWIVLGATGGVYYYLTQVEKIKLFSRRLMGIHFIGFILLGLIIYTCYLIGKMGGREYLEYLPALTIPILLGWVLFGINYFKSIIGTVKNSPVYFWMWGTGIVFMIFHLSEAHFWIFSDIRNDFIKDLTIQWKSYGSFVGSWNMLVYGTAIYLMSKIKKDENQARGRKVFFFYFLGLTNLMFGWAHHTYIIPTAPWIRYVAYIISMTEWIIFINIIYTWSKSLGKTEKKAYFLPYRFLKASEFWVFLNLVLALLMSIPTLNFYTHGTHITVAHSMGTTIGINTCILLASAIYIIKRIDRNITRDNKIVHYGFLLFNVALMIFWLSLIVGGIYKAIWSANPENTSFAQLHESSGFVFAIFVFSGCLLFISLLMITLPLLKRLKKYCFENSHGA